MGFGWVLQMTSVICCRLLLCWTCPAHDELLAVPHNSYFHQSYDFAFVLSHQHNPYDIHLANPLPLRIQYTSSTGLLQQLLRLINLGRQIRTPASIRVIQQHQLPMRFSDLVSRRLSIPQRAFVQFENESGFFARHFRFEAAAVKGAAEGVDAVGVAVAAEGDETGAAEEGGGGETDAGGCDGGHFELKCGCDESQADRNVM